MLYTSSYRFSFLSLSHQGPAQGDHRLFLHGHTYHGGRADRLLGPSLPSLYFTVILACVTMESDLLHITLLENGWEGTLTLNLRAHYLTF